MSQGTHYVPGEPFRVAQYGTAIGAETCPKCARRLEYAYHSYGSCSNVLTQCECGWGENNTFGFKDQTTRIGSFFKAPSNPPTFGTFIFN